MRTAPIPGKEACLVSELHLVGNGGSLGISWGRSRPKRLCGPRAAARVSGSKPERWVNRHLGQGLTQDDYVGQDVLPSHPKVTCRQNGPLCQPLHELSGRGLGWSSPSCYFPTFPSDQAKVSQNEDEDQNIAG